MTAIAIITCILLLTTLLMWVNRADGILCLLSTAYATAWMLVWAIEPNLWPIAALGFVQNIAFTFVSRGRNSGSLGYHLVASVFSNGIYAALLFLSIDMIAQMKASPVAFLTVYTLCTMSGSIFAHWMAMRVERGKGRSVQEDRFSMLTKEVVQQSQRQDADSRNLEMLASRINTLEAEMKERPPFRAC